MTLNVGDLATATYDGMKTVTFKFTNGSATVEVPVAFPIPVYRDVWKEGEQYDPGDMVTWGGSLWIAKASTTAKPDLPTAESRVWRLCVKRGNEGKQGKAGPEGPRGAKGDKGDPGGRW